MDRQTSTPESTVFNISPSGQLIKSQSGFKLKVNSVSLSGKNWVGNQDANLHLRENGYLCYQEEIPRLRVLGKEVGAKGSA